MATRLEKQRPDFLSIDPFAKVDPEVKEEATERLSPSCTVAEALDAIKLTGKLQDAQGTTRRIPETLSAGQYILHTQAPTGRS